MVCEQLDQRLHVLCVFLYNSSDSFGLKLAVTFEADL